VNKPRLIAMIFIRMLLLLTLFFVALTWFTLSSYRAFFYQTTQAELHQRAAMFSDRFTQLIQTAKPQQSVQSTVTQLAERGKVRITVILPDGSVLADSHENPAEMENHLARPEVQSALQNNSGHNVRYSNTIEQQLLYTALTLTENGTLVGVLRMAVSTEALQQWLTELIIKILFGGLIIVIGAAISAWWISRRISRPLETLKQGAADISKGNLNKQIPAFMVRELDAMSQSMNRMAAELQKRILTITSQQRREKQILTNMLDGIISITPEGYIAMLNPSAAKLLHVSETHTPGKHWQEVVEIPELQEFIRACLSERPEHAEAVVYSELRKSYLQARFGPLKNLSDDSFAGALVLLQDVTQARRMEIMRKDFVSSVSHELRTPVTAIKGFVETLLDEKHKLDSTTVNFLQIVRSHSDRLINIVNDLLSLSHIEHMNERGSIEFEVSEIEEPVLQAVQACSGNAAEREINLITNCEPGIRAHINSQLITQACINLIDNAVKYSQPNTEVKISSYKDFKGYICISVSDNGLGIPADHQDRIFERFYRIDKARSREMGGTGLGLAIVKHIVRAHNGSITVSSREDIGSTFIISLPPL
jgi:two-component system, OmpR family, phosphate regulon sensor histidine kinase PhoR